MLKVESLHCKMGTNIKNTLILTVLESRYTAGAQNKDFSAVSQTDLTRDLFHL